jgi:hypothetical protein
MRLLRTGDLVKRKPPQLSIPPHPFQPDPEVPDWRRRLAACQRCPFPSSNRIHTEYEPVDDDSSRILGEGADDAA